MRNMLLKLISSQAELQKPRKPTNLVLRKVFAKTEEGFVDSAPIPFSWESGNQLMNRFLKGEAALILKPG